MMAVVMMMMNEGDDDDVDDGSAGDVVWCVEKQSASVCRQQALLREVSSVQSD